MEMDTDSLYLALGDEAIDKCIKPERLPIWNIITRNDCTEYFRLDSNNKFFSKSCFSQHRKYDQEEPCLFKEKFRCTEMICVCSETYCRFD